MRAEYSPPFLDCPSCDYADIIEQEQLAPMISSIHEDDDNPFAILSIGDGTFIQTYRTEDGFALEHQLVTTECHYEVPELLSEKQVIAAMDSYAFGKLEWLEAHNWQLQDLDAEDE